MTARSTVAAANRDETRGRSFGYTLSFRFFNHVESKLVFAKAALYSAVSECAPTSEPAFAGPGLVIMGVTKDMASAGDGKTFPKTGDELTMHYTGWLARTETKFDSSVDKGKPFVFKVNAF